MKASHIGHAIERFQDLKKSPQYSSLFKEYTGRDSLVYYKYVQPTDGEHLVSLHNHSDGLNYDLDDIARTAARRHIKVLAVTDHNSDIKFDGKKVLYWPYGGGVFLIRGMEVRCKEKDGTWKDIIFTGYNKNIAPFKNVTDTLKRARDNDSLNIGTSIGNDGAHGLSLDRILEMKSSFDAVEILDSSTGMVYFRYSDILANEFAKKNNLPGIFAEDAHTLREIGLSAFGVKQQDLAIPSGDANTIRDWLNSHGDTILIHTLRKILKNNQFTNYGGYMPRFSLFYPDKFLTLAHENAVLKPFENNEFISADKI